MKLPELSTTEFGLIGHPLGHSRSKELFAARGRSYENFDLPALTPAALYQLVLINPRLKGFNVTAPYKEAIIPYLDKLDPTAAAVGAVNTVKIRRAADGRILGLDGYNTDFIGFRDSALEFLGDETAGLKALVLGTGGAAKAVAAVLDSMGIEYKYVSRSRRDERTISYDDLNVDVMAEYLFIINATPLGTYPAIDEFAPIPYDAITPQHRCYDIVYNPEETEFMKRCADRGARVCNGFAMLEGQADAALKIFENNQL